MKKALLVGLGLAATGALGSAGAQGLQLSGGGTLANGNLGLNFGLTALNVTNLNGYSVDLRGSADVRSGFSAINADALINFPTAAFNLYGGAGIGFSLGNNNALFAALTAGLAAPLTDQFGVFAEAALRFNAPSTVRFGVTYVF